MICPRLVLEVRFNFLLNLMNESKKLLAPFARFADQVSIRDAGNFKEAIILDYLEDSIRIILNPDRLTLLIEGDFDKIKESANSYSKYYFEILERVQNLDDFGSIVNYIYEVDLIEYADDQLPGVIKSEFIERYFSKKFSTDHLDKDYFDLSWSNKTSISEEFMVYSIFDKSFHTELSRKFFQLNSAKLEKFKLSQGRHCYWKIFEKESTHLDEKIFKKLLEKSSNLLG